MPIEQLPTHCTWCGKELDKRYQPGGECAYCWELRMRCNHNPKVALRIAMQEAEKHLTRLRAERKG